MKVLHSRAFSDDEGWIHTVFDKNANDRSRSRMRSMVRLQCDPRGRVSVKCMCMRNTGYNSIPEIFARKPLHGFRVDWYARGGLHLYQPVYFSPLLSSHRPTKLLINILVTETFRINQRQIRLCELLTSIPMFFPDHIYPTRCIKSTYSLISIIIFRYF